MLWRLEVSLSALTDSVGVEGGEGVPSCFIFFKLLLVYPIIWSGIFWSINCPPPPALSSQTERHAGMLHWSSQSEAERSWIPDVCKDICWNLHPAICVNERSKVKVSSAKSRASLLQCFDSHVWFGTIPSWGRKAPNPLWPEMGSFKAATLSFDRIPWRTTYLLWSHRHFSRLFFVWEAVYLRCQAIPHHLFQIGKIELI